MEFGSDREQQRLDGLERLLQHHAEELEADGPNDINEIRRPIETYRELVAEGQRLRQ